MADVTWDEIRSLRADFLNLQLTETANKLSERNCVELIGLLVKEGLLNVIYTTDGKDIITEQRLIREILDEIYANGGRINIVDLAQHLKIDLTYIESKVGDVCKEDPTLQFTLGQFISAEYTNRLVEEINDMLVERGLISFSELIHNLHSTKSRQYLDLFIQRVKESFKLKENETSHDTTRKTEMKNIQETLKQLHGNICIFSRSIEQLIADNETNLADTLQRHLIRSLCSDMCDVIIREIDTSASAKTGQLSIEERNKIIQKMPESTRNHLSKVNESLNGKNAETTLTRLEDAAGELLQIILKRPNKKTEKDLILDIREKLKAKLTDEQDPAMILHLTITLLFYAVNNGRLIHAPGKAVPTLIKFLSKTLPSNINQRLYEMQEFVIQQSTAEVASTQLPNEKIEFIKKLGLNAKENMSFTSFSNDNNETS
ncbi:unnamed protein product [Rotaria sp. Silwood2]|nr:unnamed protein product [Rotaria sp. Silwood2]